MVKNLLLSCLLFALVAPNVQAVPDTSPAVDWPVAIRWWGQETISIETFWHAPVMIDPHHPASTGASDSPRPGLVLSTNPSAPATLPQHFKQAKQIRLFDHINSREPLWHVWDRRPNETEASLLPADKVRGTSGHTFFVGRAGNMPPAKVAADIDTPLILLADQKGQIVHYRPQAKALHQSLQHASLSHPQVLLLNLSESPPEQDESLVEAISKLAPRYVVPVSGAVGSMDASQRIDRFVAQVGDRFKEKQLPTNTLALATNNKQEGDVTSLVLMPPRPWKATGELATLLERMQISCASSQAVFAKLSTPQMNFKPSNGTHTPRWNAEHMMGRQLGFFSQIYAAIDPELQAIDLNPQQMPPDYQPAHQDWTGAEEAQQMHRVSNYVNRFAYLLEDVNLDDRAPGSRWKLRGLLRQMDRHFTEHTANVVKKYELDDWPQE